MPRWRSWGHVGLIFGRLRRVGSHIVRSRAAQTDMPTTTTAPISAVILSRLQIMPGRLAFLRRRHVAAGASRADFGPRVPARTLLLFVAVSGCWNDSAAAPGRLAIGDLGPCDCRHKYLRRWRRNQPPSRQFPRQFPWSGAEYLSTREVLDVGRFCGVDRLQITCHRRSENPSAITAKTPKNGLEITSVRSGVSSGSGAFLVILVNEF
jgi:hypothetical protein